MKYSAHQFIGLPLHKQINLSKVQLKVKLTDQNLDQEIKSQNNSSKVRLIFMGKSKGKSTDQHLDQKLDQQINSLSRSAMRDAQKQFGSI